MSAAPALALSPIDTLPEVCVMAIPRAQIVDPNEPGLYYCYSRCVRQAFLLEREDRREWIEERLEELCSIFAVDDAAHSAMSNHLHVLVRLDPPRVNGWSGEEVVRRWGRLHPRSMFAAAGVPLKRGVKPPAELPEAVVEAIVADAALVQKYRERLASLSWFMKELKEPLARMANRQDGVKGAFWDRRFKSPRVLDLAGLLTCMAVIDLGPVRAGMVEEPKDSPYTSIQQRIHALAQFAASKSLQETLTVEQNTALEELMEEERRQWADPQESTWMAPIGGAGEGARAPLLGMAPKQYVAIVETAGRTPDPRKGKSIPKHVKSVLEKLQIDAERWIRTVKETKRLYGTAIGTAASLTVEAARRGLTRVIGALDVCLLC
jgi:hypothetical protein